MTNSTLQSQKDLEKELIKKYRDIDRKGIASVYWNEVLDIIKYLEIKEEYEKCQDLWTYYLEMTSGK